MNKSPKMEFTIGNINRIYKNIPGLYAFWIKVVSGRWSCIYIGESNCVRTRLLSHWMNEYSTGKAFSKYKKTFGKYFYFCYCEASSETNKRRLFENKLINNWQPRKNTKKPKW